MGAVVSLSVPFVSADRLGLRGVVVLGVLNGFGAEGAYGCEGGGFVFLAVVPGRLWSGWWREGVGSMLL